MNLGRFYARLARGQALVHEAALARWVVIAVCGYALGYASAAALFWARMNAPLHFDDGYVGAVAARLVHGHFLPYVDAASNRGVAFYWLAGLAQKAAGWSSWFGLRRLTSGTFLSSVALLAALGVVARRAVAGAFAALLFTYLSLCVFETETVFGMVGEPFANAWLLLALLALTAALQRAARPGTRCLLTFLAGLAAALAGLTKQTYLPAAAPFGMWVLAFALAATGGERRRGVSLVIAFVTGWLLPLALVLLVYAKAGELRRFFYWFSTYNRDVYMGPYGRGSFGRELRGWLGSHAELALALLLVLLAGVQRLIPELARGGRSLFAAYRDVGFEATCVLVAVLTLAGTIMPLRFWSQYELAPAPWFALLLGLGLEHFRDLALPRGHAAGWRTVMLVVNTAVIMLLTGTLLDTRVRHWRRERASGKWGDARPEQLCKSVDAYARPGEPLFVWGFDADVYVTCARRPASRYVYTTIVAGVVPPFWQDPQPRYVAKNARRELLADLRRERPPVILDYPGRMGKLHADTVPELAALLGKSYCSRGDVKSNNGRAFALYVRADRCEQQPH